MPRHSGTIFNHHVMQGSPFGSDILYKGAGVTETG